MISNKINLFKKRENICVILIYTIITLIMTYPVAFKAGIPGYGEVFKELWFFWWFKNSLLTGTNLFFTDNIFYPNGISMIFGTEPSIITSINAIMSVPLQQVFGLINSYKIFFLFTFIASGYGTYLLVRYLTGDKRAAFISGLIYMFSPYHFVHALGHSNFISIQWIPFYVLFLIKMTKENKKSNAVYAAIFFLLTAMSSSYFLVYLSVLTLMFFVYYYWVDRNYILAKNTLKNLSLMLLILGLLFSPFVYLFLHENPLDESQNISGGQYIAYSADLLGFFIPTLLHPVFKDHVSPIYANFTGNIAEYTVFIGYTVLFLAILAVLKIKTREIKFWALSAFIFAIFCLGPILHINGILSDSHGSYTYVVLLPFALITKIPFISLARVPSRWDILVMLSLAILAGYGINYILKRFDGKHFTSISNKNALTVIFSGLILFEFLVIPFPMSSAEVPDFYNQIKNDPDNYAILEFPKMLEFSQSLYYQTIHGKKLVNGQVARFPQKILNFLSSTPVLGELFSISEEKPFLNDIINQNNSKIGGSVLNYYNIRYVVLHKDIMSQDQIGSSNKLLQNVLNKQPEIYEKDGLQVYKVEKKDYETFVLIGDGWDSIEYWNDVPGRWMNDNATIKIISNKDINSTLYFEVGSFYQKRPLNAYLNENLSGKYTVGINSLKDNTTQNITMHLQLRKGENIVRFNSQDKGTVPSDVSAWNDDRELSLAFQNITLVQYYG